MSQDKYDLVVIGGGLGGYPAALKGSKIGFKCALIESNDLGGTCLNRGCIPTKALIHCADELIKFKKADKLGIKTGQIEPDFPTMVERAKKIAATLRNGVAQLLKSAKVDVYQGRGKIAAPGEVKVISQNNETLSLKTRHILIATGGRPRSLPAVEPDGKIILTSSDALFLNELPRSMAIIGAGAVGVEFAHIYSALGCEVHLIEALPRILPLEDKDVSEEIERALKRRKVKVSAGTKVETVEKTEHEAVVHTVSEDGKSAVIKADKVLVAIGVKGNIEDLGLEDVGVETEEGFIKVDSANCSTNAEGIYAAGDVTGPPQLAHVAEAEALHAVECMGGIKCVPIDYTNVPRCTYCDPQVAAVGLTEEEAVKEGYKIKIGKFPFAANGKAMAVDARQGWVKLIFDAEYGALLGAHIVGHGATEMIGGLTACRTLGTTFKELATTVWPHPTMSEAIMEAAADSQDMAIHLVKNK